MILINLKVGLTNVLYRQFSTKESDEGSDLLEKAKDRKSVNTMSPIIQKAYSILDMNTWSKEDLIENEYHQKLNLENEAREVQIRDEEII